MTPKRRPYFDVIVDLDSGYDFELQTQGFVSDAPLRASFRRDSNGALAIAKLTIEPEPPAEGITSATLRGIPVGELLSRARTAWLMEPKRRDPSQVRARGPRDDPDWSSQDATVAAHVAGVTAAASRRTKRGRPTLGDDHYRRIAEAYLDLAAEDPSRGLIHRLAEREGRQPETVRDWVHGARKRGFLTPGERGRAGAEPGPRLTDYTPPRKTRRSKP